MTLPVNPMSDSALRDLDERVPRVVAAGPASSRPSHVKL
jgi:hypothetical protein